MFSKLPKETFDKSTAKHFPFADFLNLDNFPAQSQKHGTLFTCCKSFHSNLNN